MKRFTSSTLKFALLLSAILIIAALVIVLSAEILWFQELGYLGTLSRRLLWEFALLVVVTGLSLWFALGNLHLAERWKWPNKNSTREVHQLSVEVDIPNSRPLKLPWLLILVCGFHLIIGLMLLYYSQTAIRIWTPDFNLPQVIPPLPLAFNLSSLPRLLPQIAENSWKFAVTALIFGLLAYKPRFWIRAIAIVFSIIFGMAVSGNWMRVLQYFYALPFDQVDPQFQIDLEFYVFQIPFWRLLDFWLGGLCLYTLVAVLLTYLLAGNSLTEGKFPGFSRNQLRHLYGLSGAMMLVVSIRHWLARYELVNSPYGVVYGASFTDIHVRLPFETLHAIFALLIAVWLFYKAIQPPKDKWRSLRKKRPYVPFSAWPFYLYLGFLILGLIMMQATQSLIVQPNELARETPYLKRSIAFTRNAFNLDTIEPVQLDGVGALNEEELKENALTIDNIRVWDTRPLLKTNRQLQQIRLYYAFPNADYDRYSILTNGGDQSSTKLQQVMIAARELNYDEVPAEAKTWVNKHLVYTHGYGFTLSPVNSVASGGLPYYFVKDIGNDLSEESLRTSSEAIRESIPINIPRIYYGELSNTYIMTNGKVKELDFPRGQDNAYNTYDGKGGISIGSWTQRILFSAYLRDWQMLFTRNFTPDTRLLFRRNINQRVRRLAPFLRFDRNPYLVTADGGDTNLEGESISLYWMIDAYTTSDRYPYSDPGQRNFNYIRNSVKIVVDAYNGDVDFYIADPSDPIVKTWNHIFPNLFKPLAEMPPDLHRHIRYPEDMFSTQSERLLTYHMTDPQVFYNREDQWRIPQEIYGDKQQPVAPYYLIMKLPTGSSEEFILFHVYTPTSRNNLIGGLFARSDGENYGKLLMFELPKQRLIYGPEQIEALINQTPSISQQISLWNRKGSSVIQGNLLVIPIDQSLLYIEPLYLEATENSLPTLTRVIAAYEDKIVMKPSLEEALDGIFDKEN